MSRSSSREPELSSLRRSARVSKRSQTYAESPSSTEGEVSDAQASAAEDGDQSEEEYVEVSKTPKKRTKTTLARRKRSKLSTFPKTAGGIPEDFEENYLYEALLQPETSTRELTIEWIEAYERDAILAITTLVNLLLRCCGCVHLLQPHDLSNMESATETIGEVQIAFELQKTHEYPFVSNNKALKFFRKNVLDFIESLVDLCHERGLLYKSEDAMNEAEEETSSLSSHLMTQSLTWITALSISTVRPLRLVATTVLLTMQTQLCSVMDKLVSSQEKTQRQLSLIKTKARSKKRADSMAVTIESYHSQIETIKEYFEEIFETVFIHRYRDIDPTIRQECIRHLGEWMSIFPEHFFQSSYLRYLGWLLSDPAHQVRLEVVRVLLRLYKSNNNYVLSVGFRQFTDRFKRLMINMSHNDFDSNVRLASLSCLVELQRIGFLEEADCVEITLQSFELDTGKSGKLKSVDDRHRHELSRFIASMVEDSYKTLAEKWVSTLATLKVESKERQVEMFMKLRILIDLLQKAKVHHHRIDPATTDNNSVSILFEGLYQQPAFAKSFVEQIQYLTYDYATLGSSDEESEMTKFLELKEDNEIALVLSFIMGSFLASSKKKASVDKDETHESLTLILANHLPTIEQTLSRSASVFTAFMNIWNATLEDETVNIFKMYSTLDQIEVFNELVENILKFYRHYVPRLDAVDDLLQAYEKTFAVLLRSYSQYGITADGALEGVHLTSRIRLFIQDMVLELMTEANQQLAAISETSSEVEDFQSGGTHQFEKIFHVTPSLMKLIQISDYIDLNEFEPTRGLTSKLLSVARGLNLRSYIEKTPSIYLDHHNELLYICRAIFDYFLTINSWKLENLMNTPSATQQNHDLEAAFPNLPLIIELHEKFLAATTRIIITRPNQQKCIRDLQTLFCFKSIDFVVSMKVFYTRFRTTGAFKNFDYLEKVGKDVFVARVNELTEALLLDVFLHKEGTLGVLLGVELERRGNEDVNFGVTEDETDPTNQSETESSRFEQENALALNESQTQALEQKKLQELWELEKDLCSFTLKLVSLVKLSSVSKAFAERLELNAKVIGGLFYKIVDLELTASPKVDRVESATATEIPLEVSQQSLLTIELTDDADAL